MRTNHMYSGGGLLEDFKRAFNRPNNAVIQLILINVVVFLTLLIAEVVFKLAQMEGVYHMIVSYLMIPSNVQEFITQPWTLITYFFTHTGFFHILFNMLFLFWFGKLIQEFLGSEKVVNLYILGGIAGALTYLLMYNVLPLFSDQVDQSFMLGASAGVYAIVVGAATFMPNYTFFLLFIGPVKIKYIALFYVFVSLYQTIGDNAGGNFAHLGGAMIGFLYIKQLQQGNDLGGWVSSSLNSIKRVFTREPKIKVSYKKESSKWASYTSGFKSSSSKANPGKVTVSQAEIDAILDKISDSGYESLSHDEKQKLFNASKK